MQRQGLLLVLIASGCGRLGFATGMTPGPGMDAGARDDAGIVSVDAGRDTGIFDIDGDLGEAGVTLDAGSSDAATPVDASLPPPDPFLAITPVIEILSDSEDDDPTLIASQLEIYFTSGRPGLGAGDIWRSTRATTTDTWEAPTNVAAFNTVDDETTPNISPDGLTMYFARGPVAVVHDIYHSTRVDLASPWSPPVLRADISSPTDDLDACPAPDGLAIIVDRTMLAEIWASTRALTTDAWSTPLPVTGIDVPGVGEAQAWLGTSAIYFTTQGGAAGQDIWTATRIGPTSFSDPRPVVELNTAANDSDPWLSDDLRTIYFTRADDIYVATR